MWDRLIGSWLKYHFECALALRIVWQQRLNVCARVYWKQPTTSTMRHAIERTANASIGERVYDVCACVCAPPLRHHLWLGQQRYNRLCWEDSSSQLLTLTQVATSDVHEHTRKIDDGEFSTFASIFVLQKYAFCERAAFSSWPICHRIRATGNSTLTCNALTHTHACIWIWMMRNSKRHGICDVDGRRQCFVWRQFANVMSRVRHMHVRVRPEWLEWRESSVCMKQKASGRKLLHVSHRHLHSSRADCHSDQCYSCISKHQSANPLCWFNDTTGW